MDTKRNEAATASDRLYSIIFFARGQIVPGNEFLEAASDEDALDRASRIRPWMTREVWDRHRLVRVLPPNGHKRPTAFIGVATSE
jgi:hypothetical protein